MVLKIFDFREYQKANTNADGTTNVNETGFFLLNNQPPLNLTDSGYLKEFAARVGYYRNSFYVYVQSLEKAIPACEVAITTLKKNYE